MGIKTKHGFALPTVMITSVVMLVMLLTGLVTVSSANVSIRNQYYDQLAKEAAESGVNFVVACIRADTTPTSGAAYTPQSTSCSNNAINGSKSAYVTDTSGTGGTIIKTRYSVNGPVNNGNGYYVINSTGYAELYRTSSNGSGGPWQTVSRTVSFRIQVQSLFPNYSSSGSELVCGLLNFQAYCWGSNQDGRLGNGTIDAAGQTYEADSDNQLGLYNAGNPVITKVVRPNDTVFISGVQTSAPNQANSQILDHEVAIAAGGGFACAVTTTAADGTNGQGQHSARKVVCWGDTTNGQLGNNNSSGTYRTYPVSTAARWETDGTYAQYPSDKIASTGGTTCVIAERRAADSDGNTWCWGNNSDGQVGFNNTSQSHYQVPKRVYNQSGASSGVVLKDIAASPNGRAICGILDANNKAVCWGRNEFGNIGNDTDGSINSTYLKIAIPNVVLNSNGEDLYVSDISPGGTSSVPSDHTCAVSRSNSNSPNTVGDKLYCWGANEAGEIGQGTVSNGHFRKANLVSTIRDIDGNTTTNYTATQVVSANQTTCAVISVRFSGDPGYHTELACWGSNGWGEVGVGQPGTTQGSVTFASTYSRPTVVPFFTGKTIKSIDGGAFRFCAVVKYSNYCWGRDYAGQVGDGQANAAEWTPTKSIFLEPDYTGLTY